MSKIFTKEEAKLATDIDLAQSILDNSDGRPMSYGFMTTAAIELAKRIVGGEELPKVDLSHSRSQGFADGRKTKAMKGIEERYANGGAR